MADAKERTMLEFARRKNYRRAALLAWPAAFGLAVLRSQTPPDSLANYGLGALVVLSIFSFLYVSWRYWRCPACEAGLGRDWSPIFCLRCGARLRP